VRVAPPNENDWVDCPRAWGRLHAAVAVDVLVLVGALVVFDAARVVLGVVAGEAAGSAADDPPPLHAASNHAAVTRSAAIRRGARIA